MTEIERIIQKMKLNTTSQDSEVNYKCKKCRDTTWIETEEGFKRCECYEKEGIKRMWSKFGLDPQNTLKLNDYKPYDEVTKIAKEKAINYIKEFNKIKNTKENSFGLFGQPGAGKSHIIIAIGVALLKENIQVVYMPYLEVIRELKASTLDQEYYIKLISKYQCPTVLIIDDLFKDKIKNDQLIKDRYGNIVGLSESDVKHIYPILNYRYLNDLPTLISTECTQEMLIQLDEALAGRILERCGENMVTFKGPKYNYRMRKFA
ncbi:MerR family transcriptional regulator [Clostridium botulinum]|nr:MerR family transcriptional regulator [Clostridium botulinum]